MNLEETFFLDTEDGSQECKVITSIYSETRKKYYLIYEPVLNTSEDVFVSSYQPDDENGTLEDVTNEEEMQEIMSFLQDYEDAE